MSEQDPFSEDNYRIIQFVQLSRIYDALVTLIQIQDPTAAAHLLEVHAQGGLVAPSPDYSGEFLWDTANSTPQS